MLRIFGLKKYPFQFNGETFYAFNKEYIHFLLGKRGNQTAINTAGSAWKKDIHRYVNERQADKTYRNPKWLEIYNFLQGHLSIGNSILSPDKNLIVDNLDEMTSSTSPRDLRIAGEYFKFRDLLRQNLIYFKKNHLFRKKILKAVFTDDGDFRRDVLPQYMYILLTLYIARKYSIYHNYRYKEFALKTKFTRERYEEIFFKGLRSDSTIENLTALCYTQYFWFDYRLSSSEHSEIHKILFNMYNELNLSS